MTPTSTPTSWPNPRLRRTRSEGTNGQVLYLVICAAGPASRTAVMVRLAQAEGWSVYCLAIPAQSNTSSMCPR